MDYRRNILVIDGIAASMAGIAILSFTKWLQDLHKLPSELLVSIALINLLYAIYSLSLSVLKNRLMILVTVLVIANSIWAINCLRLALNYWDTASTFGLLHLFGEAIFVGTLAYLEWKWRDSLVNKPLPS
ncbi:hypothetical protein KDW99_08575 [Marinomonas rhizomae]|uniref:hypothetical protein n=1 Tax=Marinomonas rhizomae TaxID=491948 RepID=UPI0021022519|nr:hypothetical protein [Marinomonas rhizomae]UTW01164.1 hypothetical protein KDW99_08575 [Marinomonas rhizomae]